MRTMSGKVSGKFKSGKAAGSSDAFKSQSHSSKAGLQFTIGHIHRLVNKSKYVQCVGASAPVYLAAVLEYLAAEILELAGNAAGDNQQEALYRAPLPATHHPERRRVGQEGKGIHKYPILQAAK
ncbi:histone-fold-containing protein [Mycena galopus ATCC 62051]|nr:histone-fold-containing protein [Mycena galopus ATCC 62051]